MSKIALVIVWFFSISSMAQEMKAVLEEERQGEAFRALFYNVENLFDTIDNSGVQDEEFLPDAKKQWDTKKYRIKVANLAKAIRAAGGWQPPELVGLAEIENRKVLYDLANHGALKSGNYEIVHFDSDDPRGIDVALLYAKDQFFVLYSAPIKMHDDNVRTRDILYVKLLVESKDTLHVFVNHWPSRRGGKEQSEAKRVMAAEVLKNVVDSLLSSNNKANILVMGDFNDSPTDKSLGVLTVQPLNSLVNLMAALPNSQGSHKYNGIWDYLDQLLISEAIANGDSGLKLKHRKAFVFNISFLVEEDDRYEDHVPFRSWKGPAFTAGFSDHLPVFIDITYR